MQICYRCCACTNLLQVLSMYNSAIRVVKICYRCCVQMCHGALPVTLPYSRPLLEPLMQAVLLGWAQIHCSNTGTPHSVDGGGDVARSSGKSGVNEPDAVRG